MLVRLHDIAYPLMPIRIGVLLAILREDICDGQERAPLEQDDLFRPNPLRECL